MRPVSMVSSLPPTITPSRTNVIVDSYRKLDWGVRGEHASPEGEGVAGLLANPERVDELAIAVDTLRLEIVEEPATLTDQLQEPTARMMVLRVGLEVLREVSDPLGEERDLHLGGTGVPLVRRELLDHVLLATRGKAAHD